MLCHLWRISFNFHQSWRKFNSLNFKIQVKGNAPSLCPFLYVYETNSYKIFFKTQLSNRVPVFTVIAMGLCILSFLWAKQSLQPLGSPVEPMKATPARRLWESDGKSCVIRFFFSSALLLHPTVIFHVVYLRVVRVETARE